MSGKVKSVDVLTFVSLQKMISGMGNTNWHVTMFDIQLQRLLAVDVLESREMK